MHVQADSLCGQGLLGHQASRRQHASSAGQEADHTLLQVGLVLAYQAMGSHSTLAAAAASNARIRRTAVTTRVGAPTLTRVSSNNRRAYDIIQ